MMSEEYSKPEPGVMHEVDAAFYKFTVQQRDAAWREIDALKAERDAAVKRAEAAERTLGQNRYSGPVPTTPLADLVYAYEVNGKRRITSNSYQLWRAVLDDWAKDGTTYHGYNERGMMHEAFPDKYIDLSFEAKLTFREIKSAPTPKPQPVDTSGMTQIVRIDEMTLPELMTAIGTRLRIANENMINDDSDEAALRQMHNALVLMYCAMNRGAS